MQPPAPLRRVLRRALVLLGMLTLLLIARPTLAQQQLTVRALNALLVELWPDYDRRSVLVLYTLTLPLEQPLPATLVLPLPPDATLNAVARFTPDGNNLIDDVIYSIDEAAGTLTITTSALRLRVEYYQPYTAEGLTRRFRWQWQSPIDVAQLNVSVQQPAAATTLSLNPPAANIAQSNDGLQYHNSANSTAPANQPIALDVQYTLAADQLTAGDSAPATAPTAAQDGLPRGPLLAIGFGSAGLLAVAIYVVWQRQQAQRPARPRPQRTPAASRNLPAVKPPPPVADARFCPQCGQAVGKDDLFCRTCGANLR